jgi:hypothetical protein
MSVKERLATDIEWLSAMKAIPQNKGDCGEALGSLLLRIINELDRIDRSIALKKSMKIRFIGTPYRGKPAVNAGAGMGMSPPRLHLTHVPGAQKVVFIK